MTTTKELESLWAAVCEFPEDWDRRRILADWYEEQGREEEARCLRWQLRNKLRSCGGGCHLTWYNKDTIESKEDPQSNLPETLFNGLTGYDALRSVDGLWKDYPSQNESEKALIGAWLEARKAGWNPDEPA